MPSHEPRSPWSLTPVRSVPRIRGRLVFAGAAGGTGGGGTITGGGTGAGGQPAVDAVNDDVGPLPVVL